MQKISKKGLLKELETQWKKKEVLCKQVLGPIYSKANKKKAVIKDKAKRFIDKNCQVILISFLQNQKVQNILGKMQDIIEDKNFIQRIDQYKSKYNQYIDILRDKFYNRDKNKGFAKSYLKPLITKTEEVQKNRKKPKSKNNLKFSKNKKS